MWATNTSSPTIAMCEPTTIAMLAVAVVGAVTQKSVADKAAAQQAEAVNNSTRESYRVAQEQDRAAQAQAFEAQTDRVRKASQQLSMARVIAAQGGGSLAARAININAGAAEDYSRIDASLTNKRASVLGAMAAGQTQNADALASVNTTLQGNQVQFLSSIGSAAVTAGAGSYAKATERKLQTNIRPGEE